MKKTAVLGVTSGISAYKILDLVKLLRKEHINVHIIMTQNTTRMVSQNQFKKNSGNPVLTDLFPSQFDYKAILKKRKVEHIDIADQADIFVVAPATANIIAKLAHGIADDFLTTTALAVTAPILICPSMNVNMWNNPIVQQNIQKLRQRGYIILHPDSGMLACGYEGVGRLPHTTHIKDEILLLLRKTEMLRGKKILITSGPTIEPIDSARVITNLSSGKMGNAIADACYLAGAQILLLRAKTTGMPRYSIPQETFSTSADLWNLLKKNVKQYDMLIHVAAVSDFSLAYKEKKLPSSSSHILQLTPQKKIIDSIKKLNPHIQLIGFKAAYAKNEQDLTRQALKLLKHSQADIIIANDISKKDRGFGSDYNEVFIITTNGKTKLIPLDTKNNIATLIVDFIIDYTDNRA